MIGWYHEISSHANEQNETSAAVASVFEGRSTLS